MYKLRLLQAILLSLFASPALAASPAAAPSVPPATSTAAAVAAHAEPVAETEKAQPSLFDDPQKVEMAHLSVKFGLSPDRRNVDTIAVHPYPVKPPAIPGPPTRLPEKPKDVRQMLLATGYNQRANPDKAYQPGGWRMQYAFAEAQRRSHAGVPHTLVGAYLWADEVTPYAVAECKRWNQFEEERFRRYKKAVEEFEKTRVDIENDAIRQGLTAMPIREHKNGSVEANLPAGNWWLTCTRKRPGLTYYWQVPFTAAAGEKVNLTLSQGNALIITGGW